MLPTYQEDLSDRLIVVIDDNPDVLNGMKASIDCWGCAAVYAKDANSALVELIASDLRPDCIVSDYHLAHGQNGIEAIEQIRMEFAHDISGILMTSDPNPEIRGKSRQKELGFVAKPVNMAKLRALIGQQFADRRNTAGRLVSSSA